MTVDPKVYALAEGFVEDMMAEVFRTPLKVGTDLPPREALVQRAAEAMQQAIEQECEAIREELER